MRICDLICQLQFVPDSIPSKTQELELLKTLPFDEFVNRLVTMVVSFTINLTLAILVFMLGKFLIRKLHHLLARIFVSRTVDASLSTFVLSFVNIALYFVLIVIVIGILGIETSSFIALFASAGVAIGMAFSGTLQNFAGGVLILLLKPYKVGDYIEASGYAGTVKEIQIFNTIITTPDNKSIIIPNGGLSTGSINNYSRERYRRIEWKISISYGDDAEKARQCILQMLMSDDRVVKKYTEPEDCEENPNQPGCEDNVDRETPAKGGLIGKLFRRHKQINEVLEKVVPSETEIKKMMPRPDRSPRVFVSELADSSVVLSIRAWTQNSDYWDVYFTMNERFYNELPACGVHFPFPQLDVHMSTEQ